MDHYIVLFLSTIATQDSNGKDNFRHTIYKNILDGQEVDCIQTNESAVRYLQERLRKTKESISKIYILTSKKVRNLESFVYEGKAYTISHIELFKKRLGDILGFVESQFECIEYDETESVETNMDKLLELAHSIREKHGYHSEEMIHFDMTGGLRTVTQMLTSLLYLLKHSQVNIGYVLYSDFTKQLVEDASELFDINTLVAGIEEFTHYGSTRSLQSYFKETITYDTAISDACAELLTVMNEFSMAVSLCIPYKMVQTIKLLRERIDIFKQSVHISVKEDAFCYTIHTIEKEYKQLFHTINDDVKLKLAIIRWCIQKELLQQALTLSTEWLPQIIFQEKIFYHTHIDTIRVKPAMHRTKEEEFVISYPRDAKSPEKMPSVNEGAPSNQPTEIVKRIKATIRDVKTKTEVQTLMQSMGKELVKLYAFMGDCIRAWDWLQQQEYDISLHKGRKKEVSNSNIMAFQGQFPEVEQYLQNMFHQNPNTQVSYGKFLLQQSQTLGKFLFMILGSVPEKTLLQRFWAAQEVCEVEPTKRSGSIKPLEAYRKDKIILYYNLLKENEAHSVLPLEEALQCIVEFHYIKQLRNTINHASEEKQYISSADIIQRVERLVKAIESMHWKEVTVMKELEGIHESDEKRDSF